MSKAVTIVDFDAGNLLNVARAFEHCGFAVTIASCPSAVKNAGHLVLPGVGAFSDCMTALQQRELDQAVKRHVQQGKPLLGICVGMQMLFSSSEEFGHCDGLNLIAGKVVAIPACGIDGAIHKIPHVGWNEIVIAPNAKSDSIVNQIHSGTAMYFVHSFMAAPADENTVLATADYDGIAITAAVNYNNISGTQFHPEKSSEAGLSIVRQFMQLH